MAIVAGIYEAGYGPILGPLVVSRTTFELPDHQADTCFWKLLRATITPRATRRGNKIPVVDSKKLHHSQQGILGGQGRILIEDSRFERLFP